MHCIRIDGCGVPKGMRPNTARAVLFRHQGSVAQSILDEDQRNRGFIDRSAATPTSQQN
jgi:hypothetical protein